VLQFTVIFVSSETYTFLPERWIFISKNYLFDIAH